MSLDSIPPDLWQFVQSEVASGEYSSANDVLIEDLHLLRERKEKLDQLRADIQAAEDQVSRGEYTDFDKDSLREFIEEVKREGQRRYEASNRPS
jgi:antitoxin ParD1/3/4